MKTLDERLRRMLAKFDVEREPPTLIEEHKKLQQALREGDSKACSRCSDIKPIEEFFDQSLKNGEGCSWACLFDMQGAGKNWEK